MIIDGIAQDEIKAELIANTSQAAEKGAFGIPTFFVGDEMFYGKDTLRELKEMAS
jgi:2-hydroxychromene-2-carboxylate isomerase